MHNQATAFSQFYGLHLSIKRDLVMSFGRHTPLRPTTSTRGINFSAASYIGETRAITPSELARVWDRKRGFRRLKLRWR
jgi:hypothetical protein